MEIVAAADADVDSGRGSGSGRATGRATASASLGDYLRVMGERQAAVAVAVAMG